MRSINIRNRSMDQSKFRLGGSVYLIVEINEKYIVNEDIMAINRVSKDEEGYHYSLRNSSDDPIDWCYEKDVFATLKEAKIECHKRNLKKGIALAGERLESLIKELKR